MPKSVFKGIALATGLAIGALAVTPDSAQARSRAPAIIAGIAAGAIIAGAVSNHHRRHHYGHYYEPYPHYYRRHRPHVSYHYYEYYDPPVAHYSYRPEPWTAEWYSYCANKYRSFDARTGTFQPYHGPRRLCR